MPQVVNIQNSTSAISTPEAEGTVAFLREELLVLKESERAIKNEFSALERRLDRASNTMMTLTVIITTIVLGAAILISLDYFSNNEERYEKFVDRTEEIKDNVYSRSEVDDLFANFKACLKSGGWNSCLIQ